MLSPHTFGSPAAAARQDADACAQRALRFLGALLGGGPAVTGRVTGSPSASNAHALQAARLRLPRATLYHSAHAHPTVPALAAQVGLPAVRVPCRADGSMDPAALARACRRQGSPDAIVVATAGTPMTGAVDDVPALREAARLAGGVHLHVDGTRGGIVAAAAPDPPPFGFPAGADSVSLGGRAVLGMPDLWGAVLLGEVTPSPWEPSACVPLDADGGAAAAVRLWGVLCALGVDGLLRRVAGLLETASYAERRLADAGCRPCRHPASVAVSFARPPGWVCRKWGLDVEGERARIVAARGLTADAVDELADDLLRSVPVGPAD